MGKTADKRQVQHEERGGVRAAMIRPGGATPAVKKENKNGRDNQSDQRDQTERCRRATEQQARFWILAHVSHELRSPLARLRLAVELPGDGDRLQETRRSTLREDSARDIGELDELIGDLLLATRLESASEKMQIEMFDLRALVAEEASRVDARFQGEPVQINGDAKMLRRMVRNLLENARRQGGGSEIEVWLQPLSAAETSGTGARIVVADRGPGIEKQDRERIFEPFYRPAGHGETRDGGVGLGLSQVKQIAQAL